MTFRKLLIVLAIAVVSSVTLYGALPKAEAKITTEVPTQVAMYRSYDFFASTTLQTNFATTTTATSTNITQWTDADGRIVTGAFSIEGAKRVNLYFSRDAGLGGNEGTSLFRVQVTRGDGVWHNYNHLRQATTTDNATAISLRVGTHAITAATSTAIYTMDILGFKAIRCSVTETTDGSHSCAASADF